MRLKIKRTDSQHQLAVKLRVEPEPGEGVLGWERRRLLIHAAKTALAAGLCWWLTLRFGWRDGYWGSISAIIVLQSNVGATVSASRDRLLGTLIGAALGFAFSLFWVLPWNFILAVLAAIIICGLLGLRNSSRLAGVTIAIIMLVQKDGPRWELAAIRVGEVLIGIVIALLVSSVVMPDRARTRLRDGLAQEFLLLGNLFETILEGYRGTPAQNLAELRSDVRTRMRSNSLLMDATRNEPLGNAGQSEALEMVSQFGRTVFEALLALQLSAEGSQEDGYAMQLEPQLGRLATDIRSGFHHVARCIHNWRFNVPPTGIHLEQDIADLESRMDAVRHTGLSFSQAEIIRAYAVQLHLKQIARLLRASRIETCHTAGQTKEKSKDQTASDSV